MILKRRAITCSYHFALIAEQEAENDGESSSSEDERPQTDHQRYGEIG